MTSGPNLGRRRHRQRPAQRHYHQHIHHHAGNQRLVVHQAPPALMPSPRPALPLVPTLKAVSYSRVYAPVYAPSMTSIRSYCPTVHATQSFQTAAPQPVQRPDDSFGAFIAGLLGAVAIGAAVLGSSGFSGNRKRR